MFKRKTYALSLTFADDTRSSHEGVTDIILKDSVLSFSKGHQKHYVNWDKLYGYAFEEEK